MGTDAKRKQPGDRHGEENEGAKKAAGKQAAREKPAARPPAEAGPHDDKRRNLALRLLVDEMMSTIREVAGKDLWSDAEREAYERDLDRIMVRVRDEAMRTAKD